MQLLGLKLSRLILAVRSPDMGEAAAATMRKQYPKTIIEVWELDMCSYDTQLSRIDIAILNAGVRSILNSKKA
jgi:hypothetical protein